MENECFYIIRKNEIIWGPHNYPDASKDAIMLCQESLGEEIVNVFPPKGRKWDNVKLDWRPKTISEKVIDGEISEESRRNEIKAEILTFANNLLNQGIEFNGSFFQARKEDRDNLSDTILLINLEVPWGNKWRNLENSWIPLTNAELIDLAKSVGFFNVTVFYISRFLIDELPNLSLEEIANYNVSDRWGSVELPEEP